MKNMMYFLLCNIIIVALVLLTSCGRQSDYAEIVPVPVFMEQTQGEFVIDENTCISVDDEMQVPVVRLFAGLFETSAGFVPNVCVNCPKADIKLMTDISMKSESYRMNIGRSCVEIYAGGSPGFFYALQTIRQALPAEIESDVLCPDVRWDVPLMTVYDEPRFEYRGLMVDVTGGFLPKENLKEIIDCMAMLKLNNLHLVDDDVSRLETGECSCLTGIGAWQEDRTDLGEIISYAAARQVNVILGPGGRNSDKICTETARKAAEEGCRFVMTPAELFSLSRCQGPQWFEPMTCSGNSILKDVYEYEPVDKEWPVEYQDLLMGVQGYMWTDLCESPDEVTYQIFPRLAAVAEVAWSSPALKDWRRFLRSLDSFDRHLDQMGVTYAKSMYNIQHSVTPAKDGALSVELCCERPDMVIKYTLDGSDPHSDSPVYGGSFSVDGPVVVKAASFHNDGRIAGCILELPIARNKATACKVRAVVPSAGLLVNGVRGSLKQTDSEWCHFFDDASLVVDLGKVVDVSMVAVGFLNNYGMAFHRPLSISVSVSLDGLEYLPVSRRGWNQFEVFCEGNFREDVEFVFLPQIARYIKINASHPGVCPKGHIREGQASKFCFDEIIVRGEPRQNLRFASSGRDSASARSRIADKAQKNLIRWSTSGGL